MYLRLAVLSFSKSDRWKDFRFISKIDQQFFGFFSNYTKVTLTLYFHATIFLFFYW